MIYGAIGINMANTGKASKIVILEFINNIEKFNDCVANEIQDIQQDAIALGDYWDDPQYEAFIEFTKEIIKSLKNDIAILEYIEKNLKQKVDMF